jgi:polyphosphate kinase
VPATKPPVTPAGRLLNRELSQLDFQFRVLELASDRELPLLERVKFCAILANNIDEFFMVRVAGLLDQAASGVAVRSDDGLTPQATLTEVRGRVAELTAAQARLWARDLRPALADAGVAICQVEDLNAKELAELTTRFAREIYPVLTPLGVGPGQPFPFISPLALSLGIFVRDPDTGDERFARVKVPEQMPRFLAVGSRGMRVPLEAVISHFLDELFPQMEIVERAFFRVTRDADFELSDEADDLLEAVELELRRRRFGEVVRLEVSASASAAMVDRLKGGLGIEDEQVYHVSGHLDLSELMQLTTLDRPDLKEEQWIAATPPRLLGAGATDPFAEIKRGDLLVHHPYESFASSVEAFANPAARDPAVRAIKSTVYPTSDE